MIKDSAGNINNNTAVNDHEVVEHDSCTPKYESSQIFGICMAAVKNEGMALEYVKKQTPEMCLAAVKWMVGLFKRQASEMCLAVVRQRNMVL